MSLQILLNLRVRCVFGKVRFSSLPPRRLDGTQILHFAKLAVIIRS